jgi:hypothetical protein
MNAVPEPIFPEEDAYPSYRVPRPIATTREPRTAIDEYVLSALIATGTELVPQAKIGRRITQL